MGNVTINQSNVGSIITQSPNAEIPCDPTKAFGQYCGATPNSVSQSQSDKPEYGPQLPKMPATVAATVAASAVLDNSKKPSNVELFARAEPDLNRKLENIALKTGVPVSQFLNMATQEAVSRKLSGDYKTAFIRGFLTKFEELNNTRTAKDVAISPWQYESLIKAGGLSVAIAKEKDKQKLAATGSIIFDTNSGLTTPAAVKYAAQNSSDYKKLKDICQKNGVNVNTIFDSAEANAARMSVSDAYKPAYIAGFMSKFLSLAESNGGKISKNALAESNAALNNAGEQSAAAAAKGKTSTVVSKPVKINIQSSEASENYKKLTNICTLNSIDPKDVLKNAALASNEFITGKDAKSRQKLKNDYENSYVTAFLNMAGRSGKITKEMMNYNNPALLKAAEDINKIF